MKTNPITLFLCGTLLMLAGCRADDPVPAGDDLPVQTTITAQLAAQAPSPSAASRAAGDGSQVNRCILEVYFQGELYDRQCTTLTGLNASFNLRLVPSRTYDLVFWADHVADPATGAGLAVDFHYNTADLRAVSMLGDYAGNDETRDAFTAAEQISVTAAAIKGVTLKRPFGQVCVRTTDLGSIPTASLRPDAVSIDFKQVCTTFNALTKEAGTGTLTYTAPVATVDDSGALSADYLFAPASGMLADFVMSFYNGPTKITDNDALSNIPVKQNFRTTVKGNLLTKKGSLNVSLSPDFAGDNDNPIPDYVEVASLTEAQDALSKGSSHIKVTSEVTASAELNIPDSFDAGASVSVVIPVAEGASLTLANDPAATGGRSFPEAVSVETNNKSALTIDLPLSTVSLVGTYTDVIATTAPNTLVVGVNTTIERLTLRKGNVKLFGKVGTIIREADYDGEVFYALDSEPSNCYMVAAAGRYCFRAGFKGNSTESVGTPLSARLLWKDRSGAEMISGVAFDKGDVLFTSDGSAGNAVIAVYSGENCTGTILWSWHIWFTGADITALDCRFSPVSGSAYSGNAYVVMDRNLGATSSTPGDVGTLGLLYQWGRKDPFVGSAKIDKSELKPIYDNDDKVIPLKSSSVGTVEYAVAHPCEWLTGSRDWLKVRDNTLWGNPQGYKFPSKTYKSKYDPCPAGYKVAPPDTWKNFSDSNRGEWNFGLSFVYDGTNRNYYPSTGFRFGNSTTFSWIDYAGAYWTSSPCNPDDVSQDADNPLRALEFAFAPDWTDASACDSRSFGFAVRCVRE